MLISYQNVFRVSIFLCPNFISGTKKHDKYCSSETLGSENNAVEDKMGRLKSLSQLHHLQLPHTSGNREPLLRKMWSLHPTQLKACLSPLSTTPHPVPRKRSWEGATFFLLVLERGGGRNRGNRCTPNSYTRHVPWVTTEHLIFLFARKMPNALSYTSQGWQGATFALSSSLCSPITAYQIHTCLRTIVFMFRGLGYNSIFLYHHTWFSGKNALFRDLGLFSPGSESYS